MQDARPGNNSISQNNSHTSNGEMRSLSQEWLAPAFWCQSDKEAASFRFSTDQSIVPLGRPRRVSRVEIATVQVLGFNGVVEAE
jgi:hypothetical protein